MRFLTENDKSAVEQLEKQVENNDMFYISEDLDNDEFAIGAFLHNNNSDILLGFCTCGESYGVYSDTYENSLVLCDLLVDKAYRRKRIGEALTRCVMTKAKRENKNVVLTILDDNLSSYYEQFGFVTTEPDAGIMFWKNNNETIDISHEFAHSDIYWEPAIPNDDFLPEHMRTGLVRNKVPLLLLKENYRCDVRCLKPDEYKTALVTKLQQSVDAYSNENSLQNLIEIADLIEHLIALHDFPSVEMENALSDIYSTYGSYYDAYFIESCMPTK